MFDEKYILCHCMTFKDTVFIFVKFKDTVFIFVKFKDSVFIFVKSLEILKTEIILTYCTCRPTTYSTIKLSIMHIYYFLLYYDTDTDTEISLF